MRLPSLFVISVACAVSFCVVFPAGGAVKVNGPLDPGGVRWFEEMVPARDGVSLYTYGTAPAPGEKVPVIVTRNPYVWGPERMREWTKSQKKTLERGYAIVAQHCRGTGMSGGDWIPYENEREDGLDLLDFVRSLPWYNGEIFLDGGSYRASVHWAYLDTNPKDVKGAVFSVQEVNRYNIVYRNGFFKTALHGSWFLNCYKRQSKTLKRNSSVFLRDFPLSSFALSYWGERVPSFENVVCHPRADDEFWKSDLPGSGRCYRRAHLASEMPILLLTGFYDIYTEGVFDMWREMPPERRSSCSLVVDAGDHMGNFGKNTEYLGKTFPGGTRPENSVTSLDWFDSVRSGKAIDSAPRGKVRYYALWENRWIVEDALENGERKVSFPLGKGERSYTYDPLGSLPEFPGSGGICFGGLQFQPPPGFRDDVVSFVLPHLKERLDVRGRAEARLCVKSDCEDTAFYVRLSVGKSDGKWYLLRDDIKSLAYEGEYVPGSERVLSYRYADHAFALEKGDLLRVDVSSASSHFAPHPNVKGDAFAAKTPKKAYNTVIAAKSRVILYAAEKEK